MSRITKKTAAMIIAFVLAFALAVATVMTYVGPYTANADGAGAETVINTKITERVKYGGSFTVADPGNNVTVSVKTPGGVVLEGSALGSVGVNGYTVKADELGVYRVTYTRTSTENSGSNKYTGSYFYNVECYSDYDYKFIVDGYGASIPTFVQSGTDAEEIVIPEATLYYYDETDEEWFPVNMEEDSSEVYCRVTYPDGSTTLYNMYDADDADATAWPAGGVTVKPEQAGTYFFTYYAQLAGGKNVMSEEYTMQAQTQFSDDTAPSLNVSGISSSESIGTEITLPAATATDNYDERVQVSITVTHTYAGENEARNVVAAVIDADTGYAKKDSEGNALYYKAAADDNTAYAYNSEGKRETTTNPAEAVVVTFDNDNFMSFYPTETGIYNVVYQAKDTSGNETAAHPYRINVSDTTAPQFDEFDTMIIPSNWGLNSVERAYDAVNHGDKGNADEAVKLESTDIAFPMPELIDNNDNDSDLRVSFTMSDPDKNTLLSFTNIYATEYSSSVTSSNSNYDNGKTYAFFRYWESGKYSVSDDFKITGEGISGDVYVLVKYDPDTKEYVGNFNFARGTATTGSYSVSYTARDTIGNSRSQTFSINLSSTLSDVGTPTIDFDAPDYLVFREYESDVTIDDVSIIDTQDTRLDIEYYLVFASTVDPETNPDFDTVLGNLTEYDAATDKGGYVELPSALGTNTLTLVNEGNGNELTVINSDGDEVTVTVTASTVYVIAKATDDVGNVESLVTPIEVVDSDAFSAAPSISFGALDVSGKAGEEIVVGSAVISYGSDYLRDYTGFELYVQRVANADNEAVDENPLGDVAFETYSANANADGYSQLANRTYIDNIRFTPSNAGIYMVVVRAYNVLGQSDVRMAFVQITGNSGGGIEVSAASNLPSTLSVGQTYKLNSKYNVNTDSIPGTSEDATFGIVRSIKGGKIAVVGNEVTVYSTGYYEFTDYVYEQSLDNGYTGSNALQSMIRYEYINRNDGSEVVGNAAGNTANGDYSYKGISSANLAVSTTTVNATDSSTAVFELQGTMPVYSTKYAEDNKVFVVLPNLSAYSTNGAASDIEVDVVDADGDSAAVYMAGDTIPSTYASAFEAYCEDKGITFEGNMAMFVPTEDGVYTISYIATLNNRVVTSDEYTIKVGDVVAPNIDVAVGSINGTRVTGTTVSANVGDTFDFASITVNEPSTGFSYTKELIDPNNSVIATLTSRTLANNGSSYTLGIAGQYRVVYTVTDDAGNPTVVKYTIVVSSSSSTSPSSGAVTTLAVVLIIVGVLLVAGVVIYLIRFRRRKPNKR